MRAHQLAKAFQRQPLGRLPRHYVRQADGNVRLRLRLRPGPPRQAAQGQGLEAAAAGQWGAGQRGAGHGRYYQTALPSCPALPPHRP